MQGRGRLLTKTRGVPSETMKKRHDNARKESGDKSVPTERLVFARNFRKARKDAGLTQQAIKDRTGFAQSWISEVETGRSTINLDNMAVLAEVVGLPLWKLLVP